MKNPKELIWIYPVLGLLAALSVAGAAWLDQFLQMNSVCEVVCKLMLISVLLGYANLRGELKTHFYRHPPVWVFLLAFLLPAVFVLRGLSVFDQKPAAGLIAIELLGVLTTVIWEELFFRYLAVSWFSKNGKMSITRLLYLALVFSLPHAVNILIHPVWFQLIVAASTAIFLLALYFEGGLLLSVIAHTVLNGLSALFSLFSSEAARSNPYLDLGVCDGLGYIILLTEICIGLYIMKKYKHLN